MVSITARPAEVEDRKVPGHWEGDLVTGTRPSAVATLAERTSRYTAIVALPDGIKAEQDTPHLTRSLLGIPPQLRRTLTWDRGREMAEHQTITTETGMPIYLCKPRSPWQRGTNENINRLLDGIDDFHGADLAGQFSMAAGGVRITAHYAAARQRRTSLAPDSRRT
ncbi:IS30 family transposase [Streptomyces sp. NPDC000618]|uniref:IS30 family transposase n=1 Tax=Streptomyces sp. NPDC000618 TaxID=3154265 RepID=UPI00332E8B04